MSDANSHDSVVVISDLESDDDDIQFIGSNSALPTPAERIHTGTSTRINRESATQSTHRSRTPHHHPLPLPNNNQNNNTPTASEPINIDSQNVLDDDEDDIIVGEARPITDEIRVTGERPISDTQRERYMANEVRNQGSFAGYTLAFPGNDIFQTALINDFLPRGVATAMNIRENGNRIPTSRGGTRRRGRLASRGRRSVGSNNRARTLINNLSVSGFINRVLNGVGRMHGDNDNMTISEGRFFTPDFGSDNGNDIPRHLMDEVARREQAHEDSRINARNKIADKMKNQSEKTSIIPDKQKQFFTNGISSKDDSVCVLCGVVLAEGIPEHYDVIKDEDKIKTLVLEEKFRSPWQCCTKLTQIDRDLSRKIFFGRCGHVYCGRCANNVNRGKGLKKKATKAKQQQDLHHVSLSQIDFDDDEYSAPKKCVAEGCTKALTGRFFFKQLYI